MTSPSAAPGAGGRQQRPRPKSAKSGQPEGKTVGRRELSRHARFAEISPEVGVLDERAMSQALADDPAAFELLAVMTTATDENLRAAAIRLSASIVLERARAGRASMRGISRLRPVRGATDGDLDIDASIDDVSAARAEGRPVTPEDLTTVQWAKAHTAFAVDRSGSMSGARLAAAATVAAACALRAPQEHAVPRAGCSAGRPGRRALGRDRASPGRRRGPGPAARNPRHRLTRLAPEVHLCQTIWRSPSPAG